jgi:pilus assembly protein CpaC
MHPKYLPRRRTLAALALTAGLIGGSALAQPPAVPPGQAPSPVEAKTDPKTGSVFVPLQGIVRYSTGTGKPIKSIAFTKDQIVQWKLIPTKPDAVDLIGIGAGLTEMVVRFSDDTTMTVTLICQPDYDLLKNIIKRTIPTASIDVVPGVGQTVILTGYVNRPEDSAMIEQIAQSAIGGAGGAAGGGGGGKLVNAIRVGGSQHVMIDVVVAQVDRSEIRNRGSDFFINGSTASGGSFLSGLIALPQSGNGGQVTVSGQANLAFGIAPAGITAAIRALRSENLAKLLAEPKIVTQTGRPAYIRSGGRQAVLSATSGITGPGVTYEPIGTTLEVLPIVQGDGKILLEINPTITIVNAGLGITVNGALSPGFSEQVARAVVSLESGQTFAIGGLIQSTVQASTTKLPLLGDLPFVGAAFSTVSHEERETELIILVTPRLVEPMDCAQVPRRVPGRETRSPDDYEFYLETLLEAPRGQRQVWNGHCYNAAYKCDPTASKFPCVGNVCHGPTQLLTGGGCSTGGCGSVAPAMPAATAPAALPPMPVSSPASDTLPEVGASPVTPAVEAPVLAPVTPAVVPVIEGPKQ